MKIKNLPSNSFFEYYREEDQIRGVVLALDKNLIGWSLCNKLDTFDKDLAIKIAYGRAITGSNIPIPHRIRPLYIKISERALKYYKDDY